MRDPLGNAPPSKAFFVFLDLVEISASLLVEVRVSKRSTKMRGVAVFALAVLFVGCQMVLRSDPAPRVPPGLWIIHPDTGCTILTNGRGDTLRFVLLTTPDIGFNALQKYYRWFNFSRDSLYYRGPGSTFIDSAGERRALSLPVRDVLAVDDPDIFRNDPNRKLYRLNMRNPCLMTTDLSVLDRFSQPPR